MTADQTTIVAAIRPSAGFAERCRFMRTTGAVVILFVVCSTLVFDNSCTAGMIVPVAANLQDHAEAWIRSPQNVVIAETGTGLGDHDVKPIDARLQRHAVPAGAMLSEPSGCGVPSPVAGAGSSGWLAATGRSEFGFDCTLKLTGRVITELNLIVPALAPSELLDPPRASA